jgi:anti-sigma factor RsiW
MGSHARRQEHPVTEAVFQHARLQELVAPFADGELSRKEMGAVEEHLGGCARCRCELAIQQALSRALAREPMTGASASLRRRIERLGEPSSAQ